MKLLGGSGALQSAAAFRPGRRVSVGLLASALAALSAVASCGDSVAAAEAAPGGPAGPAGAVDAAGTSGAPALAFPTPSAVDGNAPASRPRPPIDARGASSRPRQLAGPVGVEAVGAASAGGGPEARRAQPVAHSNALTREIERAVAGALQTARTKTGGKVHGNNVVVSVAAVDLATGREICARSADQALIPASNLKLFTVAAAALMLGPDANFETAFYADGAVSAAGALDGDLVALAGGDPLYRRDGNGALDPWLDPLAAGLRAAGIQSVSGSFVLDEGAWLEPGPGPEWPSKSEFWKQYCGFAAGLTAGGSSFRATVTARDGQSKAAVTLRPRHHGLKERIGVTIAKKNAVNVGATMSTVTVRGTMPRASSPFVSEFSHPDPVMFFGHAMTGGLRDRGLVVRGAPQRQRGAANGAGEPVYTLRTPVASCFEAILLDSNNPVADQLFLTLGARFGEGGTREASAAVVRRALGQLGLDTRGFVQVDGSGLSKANRVSARQLVGLVAAMARRKEAGRAFDGLPVAGFTGSLSKRMRGTEAEGRVRAKTGWVAGASGLSGVVKTIEGRDLAFSILVSYPRVSGLNTSAWKPMQDAICEKLVSWTFEGDGGGRVR